MWPLGGTVHFYKNATWAPQDTAVSMHYAFQNMYFKFSEINPFQEEAVSMERLLYCHSKGCDSCILTICCRSGWHSGKVCRLAAGCNYPDKKTPIQCVIPANDHGILLPSNL